MATIGYRLKAERVRLKYSQEAFGNAAGVGKHSQIRYENGERSPDGDYFGAIDKLGADVLYIVTGKRHVLGIEDMQADYVLPAMALASEIAGMTLQQEDADALLAVAKRLEKKA